MKKENTPLSLPKKQVDLVMGLYSSDKIDETIDKAGERFDARRDALYSDTDRKIKELEERLGSKLQRALDNPLAN